MPPFANRSAATGQNALKTAEDKTPQKATKGLTEAFAQVEAAGQSPDAGPLAAAEAHVLDFTHDDATSTLDFAPVMGPSGPVPQVAMAAAEIVEARVSFPEAGKTGLAQAWPEDTSGYELVAHEGACGCAGCCMKLEELTQAAGDGDPLTDGASTNAPGILGDMAEFLQTGYWNTGYGDGTRSHNVTNSGTDANNGVLHYNLSGWSDDADGLTADRATLVREAFKLFEATLGIQFVETTSTDTNLVDFFFQDNQSGAYAGSSYYNSGAWGSTIHYAYINVAQSWSGGTSTYDDYTLQTILHEIGHAIGLGHQGSYNGSATYGVDNTFDNDSWQASMMSYFSQTENTSITASYEFLQTPMAVDWMALDDLYGRQGYGVSNAFTEDTVWGFNTTVTSAVSDIWAQWSSYADRTASTIVDGGGIDTLDLSGYANNTLINLAPSDRGSTAPSLSDIGGRIGNLAIAEGTIIENAIGGAGSETFYGNVADNTLTGNGGNDTFHDSAGSDTYQGGDGTDTVIFGATFGSYTIDIVGGILQVIDAAIDWVEDTIEWLTFADQTLSWQAVADTAGVPNTPPVASNDSYTVTEDIGATITPTNGLLANDTDAEASPLTVASVNGIALDPQADGTQFTLASGAILTVYGNGAFDYDQNGAFDALDVGQQGTDSFTYTASDGRDGSNTATVTITIEGAFDSQAPVAVDDTATVDEDVVLGAIAVLGNDSDPENDPLTITAIDGTAVAVGGSVTLASGGVVTLNADGALAYDQAGAFDALLVGETGTEAFTYTISDGNKTSTATVTVTVNGTFDNTAPVAGDDVFSVAENAALSGNVLVNDSDFDNAPLAVTAVNGVASAVGTQITLASGALLTLNANGTFDYDPNGAFDALEDGQTGGDSFAYTISDGQGGSDTATVSITIDGVSPPTITEPVVIDFEGMAPGAYTGEAGLDVSGLEIVSSTALSGTQAAESSGSFTISATGEDFDLDSLSAIVSSGRNKVLIEAYDDGVLVGSTQLNVGARRPTDATFDTTFDSIDQVVFSGQGAFLIDDIAIVTRTVVEPGGNTPPIARDDAFDTGKTGILSGNLLNGDGGGADSDPDGDTLTVTSVAGDSDGSVTLASGAVVSFAADGTFDYDPNGAFDDVYSGETATDTFVYEISDGRGGVASATVTVTITGSGTPPPAPTEITVDFETGLDQDGFVFTDAALAGVGSGDQSAQSLSNSLSFSRSTSFDFQSGVFTAAGKGRVDVTVTGFAGGVEVGSETQTLRAGKDENVSLSSLFDAVDSVTIEASGGITVDDLVFLI